MYKVLLILKYLRRRRIAWASLVAVMLCTAMVLVVISVMGGWLRMFRESFHGLSGDLVVDGKSLVGFPRYEELIARFRELPEVKAAAPVIRTFGLVNINNQIRKGVEVVGYPPDIQQVNGFRDSLYRIGGNLEGVLVDDGRAQELRQRKAAYADVVKQRAAPNPAAEGFSLVTPEGILPFNDYGDELARLYLAKEPVRADPAGASLVRVRAGEDEKERVKKNGRGEILIEAITDARQLRFDLWPQQPYYWPSTYRGSRDPRSLPGMVVGTGVIGLKKGPGGKIVNREPVQYQVVADLTVMPMSPDSSNVSLDAKARELFWLIDDSRTQVYLYDSNSVYVPFDVLQDLLEMSGKDGTPKRTSLIQIALKDGHDPWAVKPKIEAIVAEIVGLNNLRYPVQVMTWEQTHATFLGAVEKEKGLITILFGLISIVAVFLIFCIFYMIVVEKTKDIGIVKSVGATSAGIAWIFLGYGAAIGAVGSLLGVAIGWAIVHWINQLHDALGRVGIVVWNPEIYLFDTIPNTIDPKETAVIVAVAILSSIVGALVPAIRAARMHPVEALRWE